MFTSQIDTTGFERGAVALIRATGATARQVVEKETGELIKTLMNITPPKDDVKKQKLEKNIESDIRRTFEQLGDSTNFEYQNAKTSKTGVKWYAASPKFLFGVSADKDMTKSGKKELLLAHYSSQFLGGSKKNPGNEGRRLIFPLARKSNQRAAISTRIVTTEKKVQSLVGNVQKSVGRLKAGWYDAVKKGLRISGRNMPKRWVTKHAEKARGRSENGLDRPNHPTFLIANFGKGIEQAFRNNFVQAALKIRSDAMLKNAQLYISGKKNLSDYVR